jgi:DNA-binding PadR family transcriptional regulator
VLELPILGLLKDGPLHGYELKKRLDETLGLWGVSFGSLYPALARLEREGAIEALEQVEAPRPVPVTGSLSGEAAAARGLRRDRLGIGGRRRRKAYRITERGETLFDELFDAEPSPGSDDARAFAWKLAFFRYFPRESRLRLLQRRRAELSERIARGQRALLAAGTEDLYARSLVEHGTRAAERDLAWVDELIAAEGGVTDRKDTP